MSSAEFTEWLAFYKMRHDAQQQAETKPDESPQDMEARLKKALGKFPTRKG